MLSFPLSVDRLTLQTLLAVLFFIASCSTTLVHAHQSATSCLATGPDSGFRHRHRIVLGFELPAEPCDSRDSAGLTAVVDEQFAPHHDHDPPAAPFLVFEPLVSFLLGNLSVSSVAIVTHLKFLSDSARHQRSGVLLS